MRSDDPSAALLSLLQLETGSKRFFDNVGRKRDITRGLVHRPDEVNASAFEKPEHLRYVSLLHVWSKAMEATDVEANVKRAFERIQVRHVADEEFGPEIVPGGSFASLRNCDWRKIDSCRVQSLLRKIAREPADSASQLQRSPVSILLYQRLKLHRDSNIAPNGERKTISAIKKVHGSTWSAHDSRSFVSG